MLDASVVNDATFIVPNLIQNTVDPNQPFLTGQPQLAADWNQFVRVHDQFQHAVGHGVPQDFRKRKLLLSQLPWKNNKLSEVQFRGV